MNQLKLALEYQCFPVWEYDEDENLISNELPDTLIGDIELDPLCVKIQEQYDSLFQNDSHSFQYRGFLTSAEKAAFETDIFRLERLLRNKVGDDCVVINDIDFDEL